MPTPDEWSEAELTVEEVTGKKFPHAAAEGIPAMEQRVQYVQRRLLQLRSQYELLPREEFFKRETALNAELREAELRLAEYRQQHEGRN